ncbi:MAG: type IV pilin protein, partial [Planctomycetaceae bacterium]
MTYICKARRQQRKNAQMNTSTNDSGRFFHPQNQPAPFKPSLPKRKCGFTLIELLVVIAIIAIL